MKKVIEAIYVIVAMLSMIVGLFLLVLEYRIGVAFIISSVFLFCVYGAYKTIKEFDL
jgi:hypothetical protein